MFATSIDDFHRWRVTAAAGAPAIVIHPAPGLPGLVRQLLEYLNEFDDNADGRWTGFSPGLLADISLRAPEKALLGVKDGCAECPAGSVCSLKRVYGSIARFGNVVLEGPLAVSGTTGMREVFRIAIGSPQPGDSGIDLVIQPERFAARSLPALIADTYMEWECARSLADSV